jgi:hypothetical protein
VLKAFSEAMSIDPAVFQELVEFLFRDADCATARAKANMSDPPLGTEEVNKGLRAPEAAG